MRLMGAIGLFEVPSGLGRHSLLGRLLPESMGTPWCQKWKEKKAVIKCCMLGSGLSTLLSFPCLSLPLPWVCWDPLAMCAHML